MKRFLASLIGLSVVGALGILLTGCNPPPSESTPATRPADAVDTVGVVDIAKVGKIMGWDDEMTKNFHEADNAAKQEIKAQMDQVGAMFQQKRKDIEEEAKLTPEQKTALEKAANPSDLQKLGLTQKEIDDYITAISALQGANQRANQAYQQFVQARAQAIQAAYRDALAPVIRRVAQANGRTIVLAPNNALLFFDNANDLTDKVVDDLQKSPPLKVNLPEIPPIPTTAPVAAPVTAPTLPATQP